MSTSGKPTPAPVPETQTKPEPRRLSAEIIRDRIRRGSKNAEALDEQLERMFVLREQSATLKLT